MQKGKRKRDQKSTMMAISEIAVSGLTPIVYVNRGLGGGWNFPRRALLSFAIVEDPSTFGVLALFPSRRQHRAVHGRVSSDRCAVFFAANRKNVRRQRVPPLSFANIYFTGTRARDSAAGDAQHHAPFSFNRPIVPETGKQAAMSARR